MLEIKISLLYAYLLFCWLQTDVFIQYYLVVQRFLKLNGDKLKVNEYINAGYRGSYQDYLVEKHNNFLTKLIHCPICISWWLSILTLIFIEYQQFLAMPFLITFLYYILLWLSKKT